MEKFYQKEKKLINFFFLYDCAITGEYIFCSSKSMNILMN